MRDSSFKGENLINSKEVGHVGLPKLMKYPSYQIILREVVILPFSTKL